MCDPQMLERFAMVAMELSSPWLESAQRAPKLTAR